MSDMDGICGIGTGCGSVVGVGGSGIVVGESGIVRLDIDDREYVSVGEFPGSCGSIG